MWNNRVENMDIRNQNLNINSVSHGIPFAPNMIFPPPNDYSRQFIPEESRKSMHTGNPGHSIISSGFIESLQGGIGNMLHGNCNTEHKLSFTPANTNSQHESHQFYNMGDSSQTLQAKGESVYNLSCGRFPPFYHEKSHFPHNQNFGSTEMFQVEPQLENTKNIVCRNNSKLHNPYLCPYPFKNIQSNAGSFKYNSSKNEITGGKKMDQGTTLEPQIITPLVESFSKQTLEDNEKKEIHVIYQYDSDAQTNCGSFNSSQILYGETINIEQTVQPKLQMPLHTQKVSNGVGTRQLKQSEVLNKDNKIKKSTEGNSTSNDNIHPNKPIEPAGKLSTLLAEKLWDGSIQLSTSTTVSAFAFFKSGEKVQDLKWPEHLETKGKVRLQAFEKYIQELPRSRTRTLMLISLCWKPGSSEAGLAGMKEIAKALREKERVGYAEISPGFDLYVCPRSETIITILAKHGFYKGMAVLEDDQDSLIGCVIWRRGKNMASNSVPSKNMASNSVEESNSPESQDDELESKQKKGDSTCIQGTPKDADFAKPVQEQKQGSNSFSNFSYDPCSFTYVGAHARFPKAVVGKKQENNSFHGPNFRVDSSSFTFVGRPHLNQCNGGGLIKVPPVEKKKDDEDDDLPEFDFNYAISKAPSPLVNQESGTNTAVTTSPLKRRDPSPLGSNKISKKSRWDDDMPEWCPPVMEHATQTNSNDCKSEVTNSNTRDTNQTISYGCRSKLEENQATRRQMALMPNDPRIPNQTFAPPGIRFHLNDFTGQWRR